MREGEEEHHRLLRFARCGVHLDHVVAIEKGYALEEDLNIKILMSGERFGDAGFLLSGQIHFSSSAGSALSAALRGGPVKYIYTNQSRPTYKLLSNKPEIKTLQDLIGKKIAVNTFGDTGHIRLRCCYLKSTGSIRTSSSSLRYAAKRDSRRSFPAPLMRLPLTQRDVAQIEAMRVNTLADIGKEIQLVWNGVAVSNQAAWRQSRTGRAFSGRWPRVANSRAVIESRRLPC